jgi:hypothetical protein
MRTNCLVRSILKGLLFVIFSVITVHSGAQTNTLPASGNVGIGITSPTAKLQVNGSARIDSSLTVRDSMIVHRDAHIRSDLQVDGKITLGGDLFLHSIRDSTLIDGGVLLIDSTGKVKNRGDLKSLVYGEAQPVMPCATDMNGGYIQTAPFWQASSNPQKMFLINSACSPDPRLGVGVKPDFKVHVRLMKDSELHPLVIDKLVSNNPTVLPKKLMQLDYTGLLYAREVKVNLDNWSDYVFDANYPLMPLSELQKFISENNHLPNVPSAKEMTDNGLNLAQSSILFMEKIEELTLYVLQINEQVKTQEQLLKQQQETISLQQETLRLQQELIQKLEQVKP